MKWLLSIDRSAASRCPPAGPTGVSTNAAILAVARARSDRERQPSGREVEAGRDRGGRVLIPLLFLGACAYSEPIDVSDDGALFAGARIQIALDQPYEPVADDPATRRSTAAVELTGMLARGDLDVVQPVNSTGRYELLEAALLGRGGIEGENWDFAVFGGLQVDHVELDLSRTFLSGTDSNLFMGPVVGVELGVEPVRGLRPYVRGSGALLVPIATVLQGEVGIDWNVVGALHVAAGYRLWRLDADSWDFWSGVTELDLDVNGAFLNLGANF